MEAAVVAAWNRRNGGIATVGLLLVAVAAVVGFLLWTGSENGAGVTPATRPAHVNPPRVHGRLVFGMTPRQVLNRTGQPTRTQGNCWLFSPTDAGVVGSIAVQPSWSRVPYDPAVSGDLKLCFTSGHYSYGYERIFDQRKQKWVWSAWPLVLRHAPSDYSDGV
jgi:hypothetical protein